MASATVYAMTPHHPVRTRVARRLLPLLFILYVTNFVDRANLAFAGLHMSQDLGFSERIFGTGAGIFFIGYLMLQIPGALLAARWGARRLIGSIMICWGALTILTGFVQTPLELYAARFLLGAAEAAFFPGVIVYLSRWFVYSDRAKAIANFMAAVPVSFVIGSPVAGVLLGVHWLGIAGWRWLFILEGLPPAILGIAAIFFLPDEPRTTKWLCEEERVWLTQQLEEERRIKTGGRASRASEVLRYRPALLLAGVAFFALSTEYSFLFWFPTMLKRFSGFSDIKVGLVGALPFAVGLVAMQWNGWDSDRRCEQRWHLAWPFLFGACGFLCLLVLPMTPVNMVVLFTMVGVGTMSFLPCLWNFPTLLLCDSAAAMTVGLMNTLGSVGGFVGPYAIGYLYSRSHSFVPGLTSQMLGFLVAAALVWLCPRVSVRKAPHVVAAAANQ